MPCFIENDQLLSKAFYEISSNFNWFNLQNDSNQAPRLDLAGLLAGPLHFK